MLLSINVQKKKVNLGLIETIVDFASKIGAKTIAEFVSDKTIFDSLRALGVNYSQGYYTGKPEVLA
jgi:EAL domain-containing protein (putative c-di-GMP-specific phosphodiesterase class I)